MKKYIIKVIKNAVLKSLISSELLKNLTNNRNNGVTINAFL
tara:strand:- start:965 stop:1087 length:123 start_codon:yes stop_codon:yes gene_type:complete